MSTYWIERIEFIRWACVGILMLLVLFFGCVVMAIDEIESPKTKRRTLWAVIALLVFCVLYLFFVPKMEIPK